MDFEQDETFERYYPENSIRDILKHKIVREVAKYYYEQERHINKEGGFVVGKEEKSFGC